MSCPLHMGSGHFHPVIQGEIARPQFPARAADHRWQRNEPFQGSSSATGRRLPCFAPPRDVMLPTTITGSLPRPSWYTRKSRRAQLPRRDGEQPVPRAICRRRLGLSARPGTGRPRHRHRRRRAFRLRRRRPELDQLSAAPHGRLRPRSAADAGRQRRHRRFRPATSCTTIWNRASCRGSPARSTRGDLQYAAMLKVAQRMTKKPVKFGTIGPELVAFAVQDKHYKSMKDRILAITDALNAELHDLADAGCPVIQFEEPQIHLLAVAQDRRRRDQSGLQRRGVQPHGEGPARQDRSVVPHLLGQSVAAAHVHRACRATSRRSRCSTRSMPT